MCVGEGKGESEREEVHEGGKEACFSLLPTSRAAPLTLLFSSTSACSSFAAATSDADPITPPLLHAEGEGYREETARPERMSRMCINDSAGRPWFLRGGERSVSGRMSQGVPGGDCEAGEDVPGVH